MFRHLDYCSCVWGSAQLELFKLQKRAARMIYDLPTRTTTAPLLKQLNWMPLIDRIKYRKAVMIFKCLNGLAPQIHDLFQFVGEVSCRSTCNSDKTMLYLAPGFHLKVYTDSFEFSAAEAWNKLQASVRESISLGALRVAISNGILVSKI